ncbi:Uncharacterized protein dnm_002310 [Desulfonema magnum]|uniref:Uncharacterized protein n=1 Tax=Desulfonema magnum TaxID=45655 RepID=A0A975GK47_9BACT|nr:Uncharacterized protein dnm_002310 [Desulfonema magnum]
MYHRAADDFHEMKMLTRCSPGIDKSQAFQTGLSSRRQRFKIFPICYPTALIPTGNRPARFSKLHRYLPLRPVIIIAVRHY